MYFYKRLFVCFCLLPVMLLFSCSGCDKSDTNTNSQVNESESQSERPQSDKVFVASLTVKYIDVGEGDCIFIRFPNGKNMLIDSGEKSEKNYGKIVATLKDYSVEKLNYVLLTHLDSDHIGNMRDLIAEYGVTDKIFLPDILFPEDYPSFKELMSVTDGEDKIIIDEGKKIISKIHDTLECDGCKTVFLSPLPFDINGSSYIDFNLATPQNPATDKIKDDISPIVYMEYAGVRFLFTGDAGFSQEKTVLSNYALKIYDKHGVTLEDIDFLKVSCHGDGNATGEEFLSLIKPENAVISVAGNGIYGHPNGNTLGRIIASNADCSIYRTDVCGDITVGVSADGEVKITTEAEGK